MPISKAGLSFNENAISPAPPRAVWAGVRVRFE